MANIESKAKLTSKGQVTIPISIRTSIGLREGDLVAFRVLDGDKVEMSKETSESSDQAIVVAYLKFLERELMAKSDPLNPFVRPKSVDALINGVELDGWFAGDTKT